VFEDDDDDRLERIEHKLNKLLQKVNILMATIQDVVTEVAAETTVNQSIVTLLDGIAAQLTAANNSGNPAAVDAVIASMQSNSKILTDAILANTPVVVVPTPTVGSSVPAGTTVTTASSTGSSSKSVPAVTLKQ
jgi:hypothetical protein